jgi:hypothetical protein
MRMRPVILRYIAFFLLLVFSQKAGAGLFVHNLMHKTSSNKTSPEQDNQKDKEIGYSCSCIDDFMMPFMEADEQVFTAPLVSVHSFFSSYHENIIFCDTILSLLRGPPAQQV